MSEHLIYKFTEEHNQDFRVISKKLKASSEGKASIDLGCGVGLYSKELAKYSSKTIAVDIDLDKLRLIKNMNLSSTYLVACNISSLPFKNGIFDFAISIEVLTHLSYSDMRLAFSELHRVLRPNSKALITMHNRARFILHSIKHLKMPSEVYKTTGLKIWPVWARNVNNLMCKNIFEIEGKIEYLNFFNHFSWDTYLHKRVKSFFMIAFENFLMRIPLLRMLMITFKVVLIRVNDDKL